MIDLDLIFFLEIFIAVFFLLLFFTSLTLAIRSKKEYKHFFILIGTIALLCIADQSVIYFGTTYFSNLKDLFDVILVMTIALTSLLLTKSVTKLT